jgi:hypothetical protein
MMNQNNNTGQLAESRAQRLFPELTSKPTSKTCEIESMYLPHRFTQPSSISKKSKSSVAITPKLGEPTLIAGHTYNPRV